MIYFLYRFGHLRSKIAPGGYQNMSDAKTVLGSSPDATDVSTTQFSASLLKNWSAELKKHLAGGKVTFPPASAQQVTEDL